MIKFPLSSQAASAALARFTPSEGATSSSDLERRRYQAKIQAMAKKELEEERKVGTDR